MKAMTVAAATAMVLLAGFGNAAPSTANQPESLNHLTDLLAARLATADTVAAAKWATATRDGTDPVIDDPAREAQIGDAMATLGTAHGLPETWVRQVFQGQIDANKIVQHSLILEWRHNIPPTPTPAMDLTTVRPIIDQLNTEIITEMADTRAALTSPDCPTHLLASVMTTITTHHSDPLHQAALMRAATPLCGA
ncbi:gamma subclass chorismate mutase AroQ [Nocardia sp. NBC_01503]|uniref:gamma subclass chorismate mutase AroQ n=1 Tax=Nocardia sp. NBC_01503 TaxID=2975997 RepID=UPI002E7B9B4E|nr:gamma subclass chorismate mutase AroQ [Nocardia sp. NBC_01503]WTL29528.1 gamma subclass chorismate mutase AroQ [Nocardia sp. NBC_01503]